MKKTLFICDNCRKDMSEDEQTKIGDRKLDFCKTCQSIIVNGFISSTDERLLLRPKPVMGADREEDLTAILALSSEAIEAWGEGQEERAVSKVRSIAARAAGGRQALESGRASRS